MTMINIKQNNTKRYHKKREIERVRERKIERERERERAKNERNKLRNNKGKRKKRKKIFLSTCKIKLISVKCYLWYKIKIQVLISLLIKVNLVNISGYFQFCTNYLSITHILSKRVIPEMMTIDWANKRK